MTYDYEVITTGQIIQVEQRITEPAHEVLEIDGELRRVKRLIGAAPRFNLISGDSGGWADAGYSKLPHERKAEAKLGRKLTKRAE